ncbi:MAG: hypothetical protein AAF467_26800 [Actinomycetota bacterium]
MSVQPNLLVIGAARSGTTALVRALEQHPEIDFTTPKEIHFFAHVGAPVTYVGPGDDQTINRRIVSDPVAMRAQFEGSTARWRGEGSVSTLYYGERSLPAIARYTGADTRAVVMLREPAARAYSAYLLQRGRGHEELATFAEGLAAEPDRITSGYHHMWHYRGMSRYHEQLPAFTGAFGDRLWIGIMEELRADPAGELDRLLTFLDVDPDAEIEFGDTNRGGEPRSRLLSSALNALWGNEVARRIALGLTWQGLRDRVRSSNLSRPEADPSVMRDLRSEFAPAVDCVEEMLGRRVDAWHH